MVEAPTRLPEAVEVADYSLIVWPTFTLANTRRVLGRMTEHLEGIVVVTSLEGVLMTVYRNDGAPRQLRRKARPRRRRERQ